MPVPLLPRRVLAHLDRPQEGKENRQLKDELEFLRTKARTSPIRGPLTRPDPPPQIRLLEDASKADVERSQLRSMFCLVNPGGSGTLRSVPLPLPCRLASASPSTLSIDVMWQATLWPPRSSP